MGVIIYTKNTQMSKHFNSSEIRCPHCGVMKIDTDLITKIENIFTKLNASKCIVSSGYRCSTYDIRENGFAGKHSQGLAMDVCYYDKAGKIIPSKIVICVAYDLGQLNGMAKINGNYTHLDNRSGSTYKGDETKGNSSYWANPYGYFGVTKADVEKYTGTTVKTTSTSTSSTTKWINLPSNATSWRVYKTNVQPVKGKECGFVKPSKFGGLSYRILGNPQKDVYTIQTDSFGKVNIYGASSTGATITTTRKYKSGSN